jgi:GntR family transcriptional regulator
MLNNRTINRTIPIPLYFQLKNILLEYITEHHKDKDAPIPTEVDISNHFGISRPTVRQAINSLVVEGYLYRIKGRGTFISKPKINQEFLRALESYNVEMRKKGLVPSTKVLGLEVTECKDRVAEALKLESGSRVIKLSRIRYANDEPIVFVVTYLPYDRCPDFMNRNLETESIYGILENEYKLIINRVVRSLESIPAGSFEAELLQIEKGAPIQYFESIAYLEDETPIEFSLAKYRGDRNKFTFELKRHV